MSNDQRPSGQGCYGGCEFTVIDTYEPEGEPLRIPANEATSGGVLEHVQVKEYCTGCRHVRLNEHVRYTPEE